MSLPDELSLRDARPDDLAAIAAMREAVGWSAHEWALDFVLSAPEAHCLVVEEAGAEIVAVGSGVGFGEVGVVGNMLVAERHRRRGIGRVILDRVLADLRRRRASSLELYATADGRPLYAAAGFRPIAPGSRVELPRSASLIVDSSLRVEEGTEADEIAAYDAPRFGGDRGGLLAFMAADRSRPLLVARRDGQVAGFAWFRNDGARLGPFVADGPDVATALVASAFDRLPDESVLVFNLPMSNTEGVAWLATLGVRPDPWDGRMALGPEPSRRNSTIYGNALGALG